MRASLTYDMLHMLVLTAASGGIRQLALKNTVIGMLMLNGVQNRPRYPGYGSGLAVSEVLYLQGIVYLLFKYQGRWAPRCTSMWTFPTPLLRLPKFALDNLILQTTYPVLLKHYKLPRFIRLGLLSIHAASSGSSARA